MNAMTNQDIAQMIGVRVCTAKAHNGFMRHAVIADCGEVLDRVKPSELRAWLVRVASEVTA